MLASSFLENILLTPSVLAQAMPVGGYISIWKSVVLLIAVLIWARLLTWTDKDAEAAMLPRVPLNLGFMLGLIFALLLFFMLPGFAAGFVAFVAIFIVEVIAYLVLRNNKVGLNDLSVQFKAWLGGFKPKRDKKSGGGKGEVTLIGKHGNLDPPEGDNVQAERAGYDALQEIFADPLKKRAERIEVVAGEQRSSVRYWVDGMPYDGAPVPKNDGAMAITLLKQSLGMDTNDRRKPQTATMKAMLEGAKHELKVLTAGSTAGESLNVEIDPKTRHDLKIDQLGFTNEQLGVVQDAIADQSGIVLVATPRGQGLTTLEYAILRSHDAFLTHIQTVERAPSVELEGITQNAIPGSATPNDEAKQVNWVVSQEPEVLMVSRVEDPRSAADLLKFVSSGKRAYVGLRAGSTFEALDQWRKLVGDDKKALKDLKMVIAGRVMRKLCDACKIDYTPDPDTLRKMNLPADRVSRLFTARTTPLKDSRGHDVVCDFCYDLRFRGRVGVFEVFTVDDEVRQVVLQGGSVNQLKMLFKKQKRRYMQEVALAKAIAGDTSLHEVARVLKAGGESRPPGGTSSSGGARPSSGGRPPSSGGRPPSTGGKPPSSSSPRRSAPPAPRTK
ncbi:hypothetical protein BH09PLA1_BH09PLA1_33810 [soil metagenome]